jgi:serine/threonine-protein kinase ULK/ATG1
MHDLEQTMAADDCQMNMSRFYIKNNKVIDNVAEIEQKEDINKFAHDMATGKKANSFAGNFVKRKKVRDQMDPNSDPTPVRAAQNDDTIVEGDENDKETLREKMIKIFKTNSSRLLHERNKYVFLASVAEDAISLGMVNTLNLSEMVGFILIKKLFYMIGDLKEILESKENLYDLEEWEDYIGTKDFSKIYVYISKEYDVFKVYYDSMHDNVKKNSEKAGFSNDLVAKSLKAETREELEDIFSETLIRYCEIAVKGLDDMEIVENKKKWIHLNQILDCLTLDNTFEFQKEDKQFNFKLFYEDFNLRPLPFLRDLVHEKLVQIFKQFGM